MLGKYKDDEWLRDDTLNIGYYSKQEVIKQSGTNGFANNMDHQRQGSIVLI